jgi:hypothetical protein
MRPVLKQLAAHLADLTDHLADYAAHPFSDDIHTYLFYLLCVAPRKRNILIPPEQRANNTWSEFLTRVKIYSQYISEISKSILKNTSVDTVRELLSYMLSVSKQLAAHLPNYAAHLANYAAHLANYAAHLPNYAAHLANYAAHLANYAAHLAILTDHLADYAAHPFLDDIRTYLFYLLCVAPRKRNILISPRAESK